MPLSTESLAAACARHPRRTVTAWAAAVAGAVVTAFLLLGSAFTTEADVATRTEAKRGQELIEAHFPDRALVRELVVVRSTAAAVEQAAIAGTLRRLEQRLRADEVLVAPGGRAALLRFELEEVGELDELLAIVQRADAEPGLDAALYGGAIVDRDFNRASRDDLEKGETIGAAAALAVLVLVFGALAAAAVPLVLAAVGIVVSLGIAALVGHVTQLSIFAANMVAGMGLALGIDYTLFILSRWREERAAGRDRYEAIVAAGGSASRAVLFSGFAVAVALAGLLLVPDTILRSLGIGAMAVAAVSVAVALTLLPALLALLGDRVNAGRVPVVGRHAESRFWAWSARRVMRRPLASLVVAAGLLLAAAVPVLDLSTTRLGLETLPERFPARQGYDLLRETFGYGTAFPTHVVVPEAAVDETRRLLESDPRFGAPRIERSLDGALTVVTAGIGPDPLTEEAFAAVRDLRARVPDGALVTGVTAANLDYVDVSNAARPLVFAFVFCTSFLLLLVAFRSLVVPVKAIVLNLLSVGAAYGLLVLVFQKGVGAELLGFRQVEAVEVWVPILLFAVLFGLSMDYHVFLLSRIRERFAATGDNEDSVAFGVASTGRVITGAALIIIVVFVGIALGELVMLQQLGFGVAAALLIDATLVRSVLVPAAMKLLGEANWYLPRALSWLPDLQIERGRRD